MEERIHTLPDGSLAVLIGSPHGKIVLADVQDDLLSSDFELPWDGRVILLRVSADGRALDDVERLAGEHPRLSYPDRTGGASPPRSSLSSSPQPGTPLTISSCPPWSPS
jgi:hypothetical protein